MCTENHPLIWIQITIPKPTDVVSLSVLIAKEISKFIPLDIHLKPE